MGISVFILGNKHMFIYINTTYAIFYKFYTSKKTSWLLVIALFSREYTLSFWRLVNEMSEYVIYGKYKDKITALCIVFLVIYFTSTLLHSWREANKESPVIWLI